MDREPGGHRGGSAIAALLIVLALGAADGADSALLPDGKTLRGQLRFTAGRLFFAASPGNRVLRLDQVQQVRVPLAHVSPFRGATSQRLTLADGQRLTGELLDLNAQMVRFRPAWTGPLTLPRRDLAALTQLPGFLTFHVDDFEAGLKDWIVTGAAALSDRQHHSGKHSLLLNAPGQAAEYRLAAPLEAGRAGVNVFDSGASAGQRWLVEAVFQGATGPRTVRAVLAGVADSYTAEVPGAGLKPFTVPRSAGWHRLVVEFTPTMLLLTVDDEVLWVSRERGPGGPLARVRLGCQAVPFKGKRRGEVFFDDLSLARAVALLPHHRADLSQDEVWLLSGDQILGEITRADSRTVHLKGRFGARTWGWGEVRGLAFRREAAVPRSSDGEHVTVWVRTGAGPKPDRLAGVVRALDDRHLTLSAPSLGDLDIDRGRIRQLRWDFHGRRLELDRTAHHLGPKGKLVSGLQPARAEGVSLPWSFHLDAVPATARLLVTVVHLSGHEDGSAEALGRGELRAEVVLNGQVVDYLNRQVPHSSREPRRLTIALPRRALRKGKNVLRLRQTPERKTGHYESCGVSDLVIEIPR